ncbi:ketopantoate reductase family protein [Granulicella sp. L46]|uniref:ketopantoate reductase family protein n=1 Tax=Granulicella sp. L46 TaxID=1641865 RepID=UPI00131A8E7F|nr:ketopantoate reductase family protein [Granulicella sp. L46]
MRILVIGAGAVGGYFGGRLAAAGRDVTFLVREGRAEQLRRAGLQIFDVYGDVTVPSDSLKLLTAEELKARPGTFDLILLSTKAYSLESAMVDFAPAVGSGTAILPLLNGMRHLDMLEARFGAETVLGGATYISADMDAEGGVHSMTRLHDLNFGERDKAVTERVQAIEDTLTGAGFEVRLREDIVATMWQKWVLLASLGAITCLMRGSIGAVAAAPGGVETAQAIIAECVAIASANGYAPQDAAAQATTAQRLEEPGSSLTASMYRDLQKGARVEADQILGDLLERGRRHGVEAPLLRAAYAQLSVYSASLKS